MSRDQGLGLRALGQLWWTMFLEWFRDGMLTYVAIPFVIIGALGLAFGERSGKPVRIALVEGPEIAPLAEVLAKEKELEVVRLPLAEAQRQLQVGRVALVVQGGFPPELIVDPTQPEARVARLAIERGMRQGPGPELRESSITTQGRRYVDFVVPGFLAYMLFGAAVNGVAQTLVQDRQRQLLKRYAATPMKRWHYLVSHALLATTIAIGTVPLYILAGWIMFGVKVLGSMVALALFSTYAMLMLSGLGYLLGSRAQRTDQTHLITTLISLPLTLAAGAFFSLERFPSWAQGFLHSLPLTALVDGLRGITSGQADLHELGYPVAILGAWGIGTMAIALRIFRWK